MLLLIISIQDELTDADGRIPWTRRSETPDRHHLTHLARWAWVSLKHEGNSLLYLLVNTHIVGTASVRTVNVIVGRLAGAHRRLIGQAIRRSARSGTSVGMLVI